MNYNNEKSKSSIFNMDEVNTDKFLNDFWNDSDYSKNEYISESPVEEIISKVEEEIQYKLPKAYVELMKLHNGGLVNKCYYKIKTSTSWAEDHIAIDGIYGIGFDKSNSLCGEFGSRFWIDEWEYPDIGVVICDCPSASHDMVFLDYRECGKDGEPSVVHIDQEFDYKITKLVNSFEEFILGLIDEKELNRK